MKKWLKYPLGALLGLACAALPVALSRLLIRNLAGIFGWIGSIASMDEEILAYSRARVYVDTRLFVGKLGHKP